MEKQVQTFLENNRNEENAAGMKRFGIGGQHCYGIKIPALRAFAKTLPKGNHAAEKLWQLGSREARILAGLVAEAQGFPETLMESWLKDFADWELCDQTCFNIFYKTAFAYEKCFQWSGRQGEFEKRAAFSLMAKLALKSTKYPDEKYLKFLPVILESACDNRNFVKKAVNWALRQIGKRNLLLNSKAIQCAGELLAMEDKTAAWIARDALRELESDRVKKALNARKIAG